MLPPWIQHPTRLSSLGIALVPMEENHFPELLNAASDNKIWEFYPGDWSVPEKFENIYRHTLALRDKGLEYPFVIIENSTQKIIGSTRLMDIVHHDKRLEIGGTWLVPAYWATSINIDCKLTLLTFCFEKLNAHRVQLKTQHNNIRSWKAIEKIGGVFEGIIRDHMLKDDGSYRSSAYFSILEQEWPQAKINLERRLADFSKK